MRILFSVAVFSAAFAMAWSASAEIRVGKYVCRTPAGHETGSTFQLGANGTYGDAGGNRSGSVVETAGELLFDGGEKDGSRGLIISETRIKVGKRIFCEWEQPKQEAAPVKNAALGGPAQPERSGAKLIVVKPELRR